MKSCKAALLAALVLTSGLPLAAQNVQAQVPSPLSIELKPSFQFPLGESSNWFSFGGGADIGIRYRLPQSIFFVTGGLEYSYAPIQASASTSLVAFRAGGGIQLSLSRNISALGYALGGYYVATYNDFSGSATDPYLAGGIGLDLALAPTFRLEIGVQYGSYLGLYQGLSAGAGIDVALGNLGGSLEIPVLELRPAFSVFYKHYDDHAVGTLLLKSNLRVPATDITVQVYIREFMDAPKAVAIREPLQPGQSRSVDLYALFTDKVLAVTEGTKVATEVTVSYKVEGQSYENKRVETLTLWGRNAMTWDDNRKAAAYVTAKDPEVLNFSRSVTSSITGRENRSICNNLQAAIALHEALDLYGMNYSPNPRTPYSEASKQKDVIDFLQFPRETFQYKAGDCSDLSILYAAMFQAVGIDAAFITVPGHIYVAMDSGLAADRAPRELIPPAQFIAYQGRAWIPLEVTSLHEGFCKAWELGAKEWTEYSLTGQAGFYPLAEAWKDYQPVGLTGADAAINIPQADRILTAYLVEVQKYLDSTLAPQIARLQGQISASGSIQAMNSLGVLYAKYGESQKAELMFKQVLDQERYLPALLNLGHLYFKQGNWSGALSLYQQANEVEPSNPQTLLALARVNQELQNYPDARASYQKLKALSPDLAARFSYLEERKESGARSSGVATERASILWEDDW